MMPSVHRLAKAETAPSFELFLQNLYVEIMVRICLGELVSSLHSAELIAKRLKQS